jgi:hypothetical protein
MQMGMQLICRSNSGQDSQQQKKHDADFILAIIKIAIKRG